MGQSKYVMKKAREITKKIAIGTWYTCVDYKGNNLPIAVAPFKKERSSMFYVCVNHLGGHVWVKTEEFRPITSVNKKRITSRANAELTRQVKQLNRSRKAGV